VGDFNADGKPDVAVADINGSELSVFLNQGGGKFAAQAIYAVGGGPSSVAVGDFNGDGRPDLAVSNRTDNTVGVLLDTCGP
jgi:hypothetical protein